MSFQPATQPDVDLYEDFGNDWEGSGFEERPQSTQPQPKASTSGRLSEKPSASPVRQQAPASKAPAPVQATTAATAATKAATGKPTSLYLGNLQWWTTDAELENLCAEYGPVNSLKIVDERQNGKSKGYAVVEFANAESAKACKEGLHGRNIHDKNCVVTFTSSTNAAKEVTAGSSYAARPQGQDAGRGRTGPYGRGRGTGPYQHQQHMYEGQGADFEEAPMRYASPQPGMMGMGMGMPMPPVMPLMGDGMMGPGPMMPMGPILPPGLPMPGMAFAHPEEQYWSMEPTEYDAPYQKRQRYY